MTPSAWILGVVAFGVWFIAIPLALASDHTPVLVAFIEVWGITLGVLLIAYALTAFDEWWLRRKGRR